MENIIKALKALSGMSDESISLLLQNSRPVTFRKRDIITSSLKRDSFFYFMEKGIARSYCVIHGKEATSWFSAEGDIVFSTNNFYGKIEGYEYEMVQMLEDGLLYAVPLKDLTRLYETNLEIANWSRRMCQNDASSFSLYNHCFLIFHRVCFQFSCNIPISMLSSGIIGCIWLTPLLYFYNFCLSSSDS